MKLPDLQAGTLVKRYKRFLADILDAQGKPLTLHCPNTGAMTGCVEPGSAVYYSRSDNAKRKYPHTLEFVNSAHGLVGVNTGRANRLVEEALLTGAIAELGQWPAEQIQAEARIPSGAGRFDFLLSRDRKQVFIEVKSVTLHLADGLGAFPDAVSARALKHVAELQSLVQQGARGVLLFCVQHLGIQSVSPATHVDPEYAEALKIASGKGVEILAYACKTDLLNMDISHRIGFDFHD